MFTYHKITILLFASAVFFSCEEEPDPEPRAPVIPSSTVTVQLEASGQFTDITARPVSYHPQVIMEVSHAGNGESNLMSSFEIKASHQEETFQKNDHWTLEYGEFQISSPDGDSIFGNYTGYGSKSKTGMNGQWTLSIQGGTGQFTSARGILYTTVESSFVANDDQFEISGQIILLRNSGV